jgi:hypothetical protein
MELMNADKGDTAMSEHDDKCEAFGLDFSETAKECEKCKNAYPEEHAECRILTEQNRKKQEEPKSSPPKEVEPEKKDNSSEEKTTKVSGRKKALSVNVKQVCRDMIAGGKGKEEILTDIANLYKDAGKEEKYAQSRARAIYNDISKEKQGDAGAEEKTESDTNNSTDNSSQK